MIIDLLAFRARVADSASFVFAGRADRIVGKWKYLLFSAADEHARARGSTGRDNPLKRRRYFFFFFFFLPFERYRARVHEVSLVITSLHVGGL